MREVIFSLTMVREQFRPRIIAWLSLLLVNGCVSSSTLVTRLVDIDLAVQINANDALSASWASQPTEFRREPIHAQIAYRFPATVFEGKVFSWRFFVEPTRIGAAIRGNQMGEVCFRFDQAELTSSMQSEKVPIKINWLQIAGKPVFSETPLTARHTKQLSNALAQVTQSLILGQI